MTADTAAESSPTAEGPPGLPLAALEGHLRQALPLTELKSEQALLANRLQEYERLVHTR